jgi:hypothetical protein
MEVSTEEREFVTLLADMGLTVPQIEDETGLSKNLIEEILYSD